MYEYFKLFVFLFRILIKYLENFLPNKLQKNGIKKNILKYLKQPNNIILLEQYFISILLLQLF